MPTVQLDTPHQPNKRLRQNRRRLLDIAVDVLRQISTVAFAAAAFFTVVALYFFFRRNVFAVLLDISGRTAKKEIEEIQKGTEEKNLSRKSVISAYRNSEKAKLEKQPAATGGFFTRKQKQAAPEIVTEKLKVTSEATTLLESEDATALLNGEDSTTLLQSGDETTLLEGAREIDSGDELTTLLTQLVPEFTVDSEIISVHTDEEIVV